MTHDWRWKRSASLSAESFFYAENRERGLDLEVEDDPPDDDVPPYAPPRPCIRLHAFGALYVGEVDGVIVGVGLAYDTGPGRTNGAEWMWVPGRRIPNDPRPGKYITGEATTPPPAPGLRATLNVDDLARKHRSTWTPDDEKRWASYLRLRGPRVVLVTRFNRPLLNERIEKVMGPPPRYRIPDEARAEAIERMRARTFVGHDARQEVRRRVGR